MSNRQRVWPREGLLIRDPFTKGRIDGVEGAIVDIDDSAISRQLQPDPFSGLPDLYLQKPEQAKSVQPEAVAIGPETTVVAGHKDSSDEAVTGQQSADFKRGVDVRVDGGALPNALREIDHDDDHHNQGEG